MHVRTPRSVSCFLLLLLALALSMSTGCSSFGSGKLAQQLQSDNDRLLAEVRALKTKNEELKKNEQLAQSRAAEAEKLLATLQPGYSPRLSALTEPSPILIPSSLPVNPLISLPGSAGVSTGASVDAGGEQFRWQRRTN